MEEASHKGPHIVWVPSYEMSQIGKAIETESRLVFASGRGWDDSEVISDRCWASFGGDENVLKWIMVKLHIFSEMQKPTELKITRWISWYINSISKLERAYLTAGRSSQAIC